MRLTLPTLSPRTQTLLTLAAVLLALAPAADTLRQALSGPAPALHSAHPMADSLQQLSQLAQQQRLLVAQGFARQQPATALPLDTLRQHRVASLKRLQNLSGAMPADAVAELQAIETEWEALDTDLAQGKLDASTSFARHTRLLDRQLALQARLTRMT